MTGELGNGPRCPWCSHDGKVYHREAYDRSFHREDGTFVYQDWTVFGCPECDREYALKESEVTDEVEL